jgi:hypothetical protein
MPERRTASSVNSNATPIPSNGHSRSRPSRSTNRQQNKDERNKFHPRLITAQIVSFQCFQYFAQSVLFQLNAVLYSNSAVTVDRIFTDQYVHLWKSQGWPDCLAIFFAGLVGYVSVGFLHSLSLSMTTLAVSLTTAAIVLLPSLLCCPPSRSYLLTIIVEKSKKCLDFAVTYFLLHLLISSFYYRVPATADWWIVHLGATILMVLVGEYLCSLREMADIPLLAL